MLSHTMGTLGAPCVPGSASHVESGTFQAKRGHAAGQATLRPPRETHAARARGCACCLFARGQAPRASRCRHALQPLPQLDTAFSHRHQHSPRPAEAAAAGGGAAAPAGPGRVFLVGTGPGDPGLLTLRAVQLMRCADVVLYDRLVSDDILRLVHGGARMVYVGKQVRACGGAGCLCWLLGVVGCGICPWHATRSKGMHAMGERAWCMPWASMLARTCRARTAGSRHRKPRWAPPLCSLHSPHACDRHSPALFFTIPISAQAGYHTRSQEEIHELLLAFAEAGATVVRLKGGDPYVFGRWAPEVV